MKKILCIALMSTSISAMAISENDMTALNSTVNQMGGSLETLCKHYLPQNTSELKSYVSILEQDKDADKKVKDFVKVFSWCIQQGYISKEVMQ